MYYMILYIFLQELFLCGLEQMLFRIIPIRKLLLVEGDSMK